MSFGRFNTGMLSDNNLKFVMVRTKRPRDLGRVRQYGLRVIVSVFGWSGTTDRLTKQQTRRGQHEAR